MINGIQAALSGLQAYNTRTANTANNIANSNTEGFKKGRVLLEEAQPQGVTARFERVETPGAKIPVEISQGQQLIEQSNVDLTEEMPDMMTGKHSYTANLKSLQIMDEMTSTLLNIKA